MTSESAAAYLAGLIDGEGSVGLYTHRGYVERRGSIANTEADIIEAILECCSVLDIPCGLTVERRSNPKHADCTNVRFYRREAFEKLVLLPLRSARKLAILRAIVASYDDTPRVTEETLVNLYRERGLTLRQVGAELGLSAAGVSYWMDKYALERRPSPVRRA